MSREYREPAEVRDSPPLHRALVFAVLDLGTDVNAVGQAAAAHIGINQTDLICLNVLFREGPMSAGQLAGMVGLTSGATTTAIDRLERGGYVERRGDPADRRKVLVVASEQATQRAFALFDDLLDQIAQLAGTYSEEQLTLLLQLVADVRALLTGYAASLRDGRSRP